MPGKKPPPENEQIVEPPAPEATQSTADETTQQKVEPHFNGGSGSSKIHTSRGGRCQAAGHCDHQKNCDTSTLIVNKTQATSVYNAHHVLPVAAVSGYRIIEKLADKVERIRAVYAATTWCINQKPNVIALPLKSSIEIAAAAGVNLPAHNFHHNVALGYTDEVRGEIKRTIWLKIEELAAAQKEQHPGEDAVTAQFKSLEDAFKQILAGRGQRALLDKNGAPTGEFGTAAALRAPKGSRPDYWYLPLSMARNSVAMDNPTWDT